MGFEYVNYIEFEWADELYQLTLLTPTYFLIDSLFKTLLDSLKQEALRAQNVHVHRTKISSNMGQYVLAIWIGKKK